ncbi:hypothetical protein PGT21_024076 [Puccinia graminis f. sp. tritici]|uniref:Uncharacterized protein n=1 Tax=Puccinia graminis f. sp. tritici TaxID=56615 RepID=A0A5B0QV03_PUCGR|nr:hypothetical protein PGT21_024076 [Puccinia graminis f. sp. tritici]KAA1117112.1 hypothetical protein PGTUg99_035961 [Puccinia graminis f. sp. tritici]
MDFNVQTPVDYEAAQLEFPHATKAKLALKDKVTVPTALQNHLLGNSLFQVAGVQWDAHRVLKHGVFILVRRGDDCGHAEAGCIDHVWEARQRSRRSFWVCYTEFSRGRVDDYYQMRTITKTMEITATMNVQHNCHLSNCQVDYTGRVRVEREESEENNATVTHLDSSEFVVNSAELPGSAVLRNWAAVPQRESDVQHLLPMLYEGLSRWHEGGGQNAPEPISVIDPELV